MKRDLILYYGPVVTDRIHDGRDLPCWFPATTKRMLRIAEATQCAGCRCFILSSGLMPRIKGHGQYMKPIIDKKNGVPIIALGQIALPWIGYFLTPIMALIALFRISLRHDVRAVIQYSFYPDAFVFGLFAKVLLRKRLMLDCEDISTPSFKDWKRGSETRPIQQIWASALMKLSIKIADSVVVLSKKFNDYVPRDKSIVVSGCQNVGDFAVPTKHNRIRVLLCGGITHENGMDVFIDAMRMINEKYDSRHLHFEVCGSGKINELKDALADFGNVSVTVHDFMSNESFEQMYQSIDVCLSLQNPNGRQGRYKVPSKAYETVCSGKMLVASEMGDLGDLPGPFFRAVKPYTGEQLAKILMALSPDEVMNSRLQAYVYAKQHFDSPIVGDKFRRCMGL